jgi:glycosyltransferase involved in cell wall biosynthesis
MRVAVDLLFWSGTRGGMETYTRELYSALGTLAAGDEYVAIGSRELVRSDHSWFPGDVVDSGVSASSRVGWARGEWTVAAPRARRLGAEVLHAPANVGPFRSAVPLVTTVHDVLPFSHPEWLPGRYGPVLRSMIRRSVAASRRIATVSETSRAEILRVLDVPGERVEVVPPGVVPQDEPVSGAREPRLLLAISNALPHKNFETLIRAISLIPEATRPRLVVIGAGTQALSPLVTQLGVSASVELAGWVSAEQKHQLMRTAAALVLPTRYEGFGLPVLEAMSCGLPVVCSDLPVLREVAGDAASYVRDDPAAWAEAIVGVLGDTALLARRAHEGRARAAAFTWARSAATMRGILARAAGDDPAGGRPGRSD